MKVVADTNILIDYLNGHDAARIELKLYSEVFISVVTWMEVLSGTNDDPMLRAFLGSFTLVPLQAEIAELAVLLRKQRRLKLPDAIVLATAHARQLILVTRNTKDFSASAPDIRVPYSLA